MSREDNIVEFPNARKEILTDIFNEILEKSNEIEGLILLASYKGESNSEIIMVGPNRELVWLSKAGDIAIEQKVISEQGE